MAERYVELSHVIVHAIRLNSVFIEHPESGRKVSVGRSTLHFLTDDRLNEYANKRIAFPSTFHKFRVMEWLVRKEGFQDLVVSKSDDSAAPDPA